MQTLSKFVLYGLLALASTSALAQATSPTSPNPQAAPLAPMSGMMPGMTMQPGADQTAPGAQTPAQQGGMMQGGIMECPMMKRSAETAATVKQLQQQVAEMRTMMEQMTKRQ